MLSKRNQAIINADRMGFSIDEYGNVFNPEGKCLKLRQTQHPHTNYLEFRVSVNKKQTMVSCARFQAYQKFGDLLFDTSLQVRHLNGNSLDNSWNNIELGTPKENEADKNPQTVLRCAINAAQSVRKYSDAQLKLIFDDKYLNNLSYSKLKRKYKIGKSQLSFLFNRSIYSKTYVPIT